MTPRRVIVVGCGAIGAACADHLSRQGAQVCMLDAGTFGGGCSAGNCGFICPSHVLPLAMPGAVRAALPMVLRRNAPLAIRLRPDPTLWAWLLRFSRCCRADRAWRTADALHALLSESRHLYDELAAEADFELQARGCLFVHADRHHFEAFAATSERLRQRFGIVSEPIDGAALVRREPSLVDGLAGAWHFPGDAHMRPDRLMAAWRSLLLRRGVEIVERCAVETVEGSGDRASAVRTAHGAREADAFVFATGAWTPRLAHMLGERLSIVPGKGYSLTSTLTADAPRTPMILEDARVAITPMRSGYRIGSTMEFAGYDESLPAARLDLLRQAVRRFLRIPYQPREEAAWFGWRPMTPDGLPFIDRSPSWRNVHVAAGHGMIGMASAPATGRLVARMVLEGEFPPAFAIRR